VSAVTDPVTARRAVHSGSEVVSFFGSPGKSLFGCTHLPPSRAHALLLVCSPLHAELARNYRREVVLARTMSEHGVAVQRFHYRGTGHSDGRSDDVTFGTLREDARVALDHLRRLAGDLPVAVAGTRLSAHVAGAVAAENAGAPLVLWEPSPDTTRHFRSVLRAGIVRALKEGNSIDSGHGAFSLQRVHEAGVVDVLGYPITSQLVTSFAERDLASELSDAECHVQIVQFGRRGDGRAAQGAFVERLRGMAGTVTLANVDLDEVWWFGGSGDTWHEAAEVVKTVAETSCDWLLGKWAGLLPAGRP
jgi:hypothetical protein